MEIKVDHVLRILDESIPKDKRRDFITLVFGDTYYLEGPEVGELIYNNFIENKLFIDLKHIRRGVGYTDEPLLLELAGVVIHVLKTLPIEEVLSIPERTTIPDRKKNNNWFYIIDQIDTDKDIENVLIDFIDDQKDYGHKKRLKRQLDSLRDSGNLEKLEDFAIEMSNSKITYGSILEFFEDFKKEIEDEI
jgi:hypothetical protein